MVTIVGGLIGGFLATIVMTILMMVLGGGGPPPTAAFYAKYIGDGDPEDFMMPGMILHLAYGTGAGGVYGWLAVSGLLAVTLATPLLTGLANGAIFGAILFVIAALFWMNIVLDTDPEPPEVVVLLIFHLAYGLVLGGVVGLELV